MITTLQDFDTHLFLALNSLRCESIDGFVLGFSGQWIWLPMYLMIAWMMVRIYGWRNALVLIAAVGVAVGCSDFFCASVIRPAVERLRPANPDNPISELVQIVGGYRGGRYGFPSCHAANTIALAVISSLLMHKRGYTFFIYTWAVLQCYSRIYLGVHYPGDLLVGAAVGVVFSLVVYYVLKATEHTLLVTLSGNPAPLTPKHAVGMTPLLVLAAILLGVMML